MASEFVIVNEETFPASSSELPQYSAEDGHEMSLDERIAATPGLELPILGGAERHAHLHASALSEEANLQRDICSAFNQAVTNNQDDIVTSFISRGLVSPDTPNIHAETPLLTAVRCGHVGMVRRLVALGAEVNRYGRSATVVYRGRWTATPTYFQRTPLQYAAEHGRLAVVKVLMEECGADDSLVAPDGALALRLAAEGGHREIVEYLPARRGGGWKRWKARHEVQWRVMKSSAHMVLEAGYCVFVYPPILLLWDLPRWVWCKRASIAQTLRDVPKFIKEVIKEMPAVGRWAGRCVRRFVRGVPTVPVIIAKWIKEGVVRICSTTVDAAKKMASVLHTAVAAAMSWFREITVRDLQNGIGHAAHAVFIDFPRSFLKFAGGACEVAYKTLKTLFGTLGSVIWYCGVCAVGIVVYVPTRLLEIAVAAGKSIPNTYREIMVHFDPKRI